MEVESVIVYDEEIKVDHEFEKPLCRCCLSAKNRLLDVKKVARYFMDLAAIDVLKLDSLPPWICLECHALLCKAVKFKHKMLRAHTVLYEYITRCAPFPIAGSDPELSKVASPHLAASVTLTFHSDHDTHHEGFHTVLQHEKPDLKSELQTNLPNEDDSHIDDERPVKTELEDDQASDFEDDLPLQEYKSTNHIVNDIVVPDVIKKEPEEPKKKKKKLSSSKKRKKIKDEVIEDPPRTKSIRRPIEIDPEKIRIITLNPEEQVKQREEQSKANLKFPYQCHLCYKGFNFEFKLQNHMQKHSPSRGQFTCSLCSMYFPTNYSYLAHSLAHTTKYECKACGRRMTDKASIYNHYRSQHEGIANVIICTICGKVSSNDKTHRGHMRNHHSGARPECDMCGKTFVNKDSLTEHLQIHEGVKNYECSMCGKRCRTRTQIKQHQLKHADTRAFYCVECDVRFKTAHTFRQHLIKSLKHRDVDSLKYTCSLCPKRYATSSALMTHVSVCHEGARPHACAACGAALASAGALRKHVASVHHGRRPPAAHVCDTCGKAFRAKSVLTNHLRTHTGEKPYKCDVCGRAFTQRTAVNTHRRRVHSKQTKPKLEPVSGSERQLTLYSAPKLTAWQPPEELFYVTAGP